MNKQKAITAHGEVEYETVHCVSCDIEVAKENATRLVMGDVVEYHDWGTLGKEEYNFKKGTIAKGWVCPYCKDSGPASVPSRPTSQRILRLFGGDPMLLVFVGAVVLTLVLLAAGAIFG